MCDRFVPSLPQSGPRRQNRRAVKPFGLPALSWDAGRP